MCSFPPTAGAWCVRWIVSNTAVRPAPLDPEHAVDNIREVLLHLRAHPGCTRAQLVATLRPDAAVDTETASEVLSPLGWLIERGHIIEFYDGTLSVPMSRKGKA